MTNAVSTAGRDPAGNRLGALTSPAAVYFAGAVVQIWLWSRAWLYWDQILLLRLGMKLSEQGELAAFAKVMSGGGVIPGSFLQVLVGAPLSVWFDYRSPGLVVVAFHLAAGAILWRVLEAECGRRFASIFLAVYWLSPWRLYHSGFIWEPNYVLLPAALHFWACLRLRSGRLLGATAVLAAAVVLSPQIHASGMVLGLLALLLMIGGLLPVRHLHPGGLALGGAAGLLPLLPAAIAAAQSPLPTGGAAGGTLGFLEVAPLLRPVQYWLRIPSADVGRRLRQVVWFEDGGAPAPHAANAADAANAAPSAPAAPVAETALWGLQALAVLTVLVTLLAALWYLRGLKDHPKHQIEGFLRRYSLFAFLALLIAAGLSTQTLQGWHSLIVLHAACLPAAAWIAYRFGRCGSATGGRRGGRGWIPGLTGSRSVTSWGLALLIVLFLGLRLPVAVVLGLGHPMYRVPDDPAQRARVAPENLPHIELERIPFGSGKESEGPEFRGIKIRGR